VTHPKSCQDSSITARALRIKFRFEFLNRILPEPTLARTCGYVSNLPEYGPSCLRGAERRLPEPANSTPPTESRRTISSEAVVRESVHSIARSARARIVCGIVMPIAFAVLNVLTTIREGVALGVIAMRRREVRPFTVKQIKLLETFAAQRPSRSRMPACSQTCRREPKTSRCRSDRDRATKRRSNRP